jgi:predicted kinase
MTLLERWCPDGVDLDAVASDVAFEDVPRARLVDVAHRVQTTRWRLLPDDLRRAVAAAALWTTRASSPRRQSTDVRRYLWLAGIDPVLREQVASLVAAWRLTTLPLDDTDPRLRPIRLSVAHRLDRLCLVARAVAPDDAIDLFQLQAEELGCFDRPFPFASDRARLACCREGRNPWAEPPPPRGPRVWVMSGLPGAGKDHWIAAHLTAHVVSLDAIRDQLGVDPRDRQGAVVAEARERARAHLRANRSFVWNATNLTRDLRNRCIGLALDYDATVHVVAVDTSFERLHRQNRRRDARVPIGVIDDMARKWQFPDRTECHELEWVRQG